MNLAVASKLIDVVKNDELRTMLATHYTPLSTNAPTPDELRLKSRQNFLLKHPVRSGYRENNYGKVNNGPANRIWTEYEETQHLKRHDVKDCPNHAYKDIII